MWSNNPGAADGIEILVVMQRLPAAADQERYLDPTIETVSTAAIVTRDVNRGSREAAQTFLDFLTAPEQQAVFVQFGFRPANGNVNLETVPDSPWSQNIPGAEVTPPTNTSPTPDQDTLTEITRLWQRAN